VISPLSSRLFAAKATVDASPVKAFAGRLGEGAGLGPGGGRLTTGNILQQALDHLVKVEPKLKVVVEKHHCKVFSAEGLAEVVDPFVNLTSGIIGQQVRFTFFFITLLWMRLVEER
jgi:DNA-3-methyladenine glycosylase II